MYPNGNVDEYRDKICPEYFLKNGLKNLLRLQLIELLLLSCIIDYAQFSCASSLNTADLSPSHKYHTQTLFPNCNVDDCRRKFRPEQIVSKVCYQCVRNARIKVLMDCFSTWKCILSVSLEKIEMVHTENWLAVLLIIA